jgi:hypothetical protein
MEGKSHVESLHVHTDIDPERLNRQGTHPGVLEPQQLAPEGHRKPVGQGQSPPVIFPGRQGDFHIRDDNLSRTADADTHQGDKALADRYVKNIESHLAHSDSYEGRRN